MGTALNSAQQIASNAGIAAPAAVSLDIASFPYLFSLVLEYASHPALALLLRCSKDTFDLVAPILYRDLRLTRDQGKALLETGRPPANRSTKADILGRSGASGRLLSTRKTRADGLGRAGALDLPKFFENVRSIHLLEYEPDKTLPVVPPLGLHGPAVAILHPTTRWSHFTRRALNSHVVSRLNIRTLIIRVSEELAQQDTVVHFHKLPKSVLDIAILLPLVESATITARRSLSCSRQALSIVLHPSIESPGNIYSPSEGILPKGLIDALITYSQDHPVRCVGLEYLGRTLEQLTSSVAKRWREQFGPRPPKSLRMTACSFTEWLDEQEPGVVFSMEEEVELRKADKVLLGSGSVVAGGVSCLCAFALGFQLILAGLPSVKMAQSVLSTRRAGSGKGRMEARPAC